MSQTLTVPNWQHHQLLEVKSFMRNQIHDGSKLGMTKIMGPKFREVGLRFSGKLI